jgi:hypothetical protein
MKKLTLSLCAVVAFSSAAFAGTSTYSSSSKNMKQVEQAPCPTWYADNEFNVGVFGTYAPTVNEWTEDRYLGVDHAWGGGIDANYFFRRYFGVGVSAFGLHLDRNFNDDGLNFGDDDSDWAGGIVGKFTFRYPIPCSRFAPYAYVGAGGIFGGQDRSGIFQNANGNFDLTDDDDNDGRFMGQYGVGFEVRFTQKFGMINDIAYNHVEGGSNDFLMVRTGLNFAF